MSKTKTKEELRAEYEKFHEEAKENAPATTEISPKCRSAVPWLCGQGTKNEGMCLRDESHCNQTFTDNKQPLYTPTRDVMTDTRIEAVKKQLEEVVSKLDKNPLNRRPRYNENNRKLERQKARLSSELEELRKLKATVETSFQYGKPSDKSDGKYLYYPYDEYDRGTQPVESRVSSKDTFFGKQDKQKPRALRGGAQDKSETKTEEELRAEYEKFQEEAALAAPATTEISPRCRSAVPWLCGQGTENVGMCLKDPIHCNRTFTDKKSPLYQPPPDVMTEARIMAVKNQLKIVEKKIKIAERAEDKKNKKKKKGMKGKSVYY